MPPRLGSARSGALSVTQVGKVGGGQHHRRLAFGAEHPVTDGDDGAGVDPEPLGRLPGGLGACLTSGLAGRRAAPAGPGCGTSRARWRCRSTGAGGRSARGRTRRGLGRQTTRPSARSWSSGDPDGLGELTPHRSISSRSLGQLGPRRVLAAAELLAERVGDLEVRRPPGARETIEPPFASVLSTFGAAILPPVRGSTIGRSVCSLCYISNLGERSGRRQPSGRR